MYNGVDLFFGGQARSAYKTKYQGMERVGGTVCICTDYYVKKKALLYSQSTRNKESREEELRERERGGNGDLFAWLISFFIVIVIIAIVLYQVIFNKKYAFLPINSCILIPICFAS